jgi:hypothetical protein
MNIEILSQIWPIFLTLIFVIIWAVRLEAKNMSCEKEYLRIDRDLAELKIKIDSEHSKIDSRFETVALKLNEIGCSLARIEGALSKKTN